MGVNAKKFRLALNTSLTTKINKKSDTESPLKRTLPINSTVHLGYITALNVGQALLGEKR